MFKQLQQQVAQLAARVAKATAALANLEGTPAPLRKTALARPGRANLFGGLPLAKRRQHRLAVALGAQRTLFKGYPEYDPDQPRDSDGTWTGGAGGGSSSRPRVFYRGTNPERTERISTGRADWDAHLFVADSIEHARLYGERVQRVEAKPDARILYEGTKEFRSLAKGLSSLNMLDWGATIANRAKEAGWDAVWFRTNLGTAILNRDKFVIGGVSKGYPEYKDTQARGEDGKWVEGGGGGDWDTGRTLYRGADKVYDTLRIAPRGAFGPGVYLSEQPGVARAYGDAVGEYQIRGRLLNTMPWSKLPKGLEAATRAKLNPDETRRFDRLWPKNNTLPVDGETYREVLTRSVEAPRVPEILQSFGYAGIEGIGDGHEIVIFDPANIRRKPHG